MKNQKIFILILFTFLCLASCGYHLRGENSIVEKHPQINIDINTQSALRRPLMNALLSSNVKLVKADTETPVSDLIILKDSLKKVVQSIGANNQVQEYRLEYDVEFTIADSSVQAVHIEKDYSFDVQQIGGGQSEEKSLRKQMAEDMAWAIIRRINIQESKH